MLKIVNCRLIYIAPFYNSCMNFRKNSVKPTSLSVLLYFRNRGVLLIDLVDALLQIDPLRRPSAEQLLHIPLLQPHIDAYVSRTMNSRNSSGARSEDAKPEDMYIETEVEAPIKRVIIDACVKADSGISSDSSGGECSRSPRTYVPKRNLPLSPIIETPHRYATPPNTQESCSRNNPNSKHVDTPRPLRERPTGIEERTNNKENVRKYRYEN